MFTADPFSKIKNELSNSSLIKEIVHSWLNQFNLVTRQEFDIQQEVLIKTRLKLEALEKKIEELTQSQ